MYKNFNHLNLALLRNNEYSPFVNQVAEIYSNFNLETLHLEKGFEKIMAWLPVLAKINA